MQGIPSTSGGKRATVTVLGDSYEVILVQTDLGRPVEYRGRHSSQRKTVTIDRQWDVFLPDGEFIGTVRYAMLTRERRSGNRTYVDARWSSPGWEYNSPTRTGERSFGGYFEGYSKGGSIERLIRDHERRKNQS